MTRLKRLQEKGLSRKKETILPVRFTFKTSETTARNIERLVNKLGRSQSAILDGLVLVGLDQAREEGYFKAGKMTIFPSTWKSGRAVFSSQAGAVPGAILLLGAGMRFNRKALRRGSSGQSLRNRRSENHEMGISFGLNVLLKRGALRSRIAVSGSWSEKVKSLR